MRSILGRSTQPISFIVLPALSIPVPASDGTPVGVELVGRPGMDGVLIAVAAHLEATG